MSSSADSMPKLIYVMGIDGSGKSTVSEHLAKQYRDKGYKVDILWLRFNHVFSKPLLGLCRLLGYTKYETCDGIRVGYHDFYKSSIISYLFIWSQYFDAIRVKYTKILPALKRQNQIVILDRYIYDILIDLAVDIRQDDFLTSALAARFKKLLPEGALSILVDRDLTDVLGIRPEGVVDRNFEARYNHFRRLTNDKNINVIDNSGTLSDLLDSVEKLTGLKNES